jgi:hypothetical protein
VLVAESDNRAILLNIDIHYSGKIFIVQASGLFCYIPMPPGTCTIKILRP